MKMVRQRCQLIPFRDIDVQRILEFSWTSGTPDRIQPKGQMLLVDTTSDRSPRC